MYIILMPSTLISKNFLPYYDNHNHTIFNCLKDYPTTIHNVQMNLINQKRSQGYLKRFFISEKLLFFLNSHNSSTYFI